MFGYKLFQAFESPPTGDGFSYPEIGMLNELALRMMDDTASIRQYMDDVLNILPSESTRYTGKDKKKFFCQAKFLQSLGFKQCCSTYAYMESLAYSFGWNEDMLDSNFIYQQHTASVPVAPDPQEPSSVDLIDNELGEKVDRPLSSYNSIDQALADCKISDDNDLLITESVEDTPKVGVKRRKRKRSRKILHRQDSLILGEDEARKCVKPLVIYAPPYSGKTMFRNSVESKLDILDTDDHNWFEKFTGKEIVLTNDPRVIDSAIISIAIVPSFGSFLRRCRRRGLLPTPRWYIDAVRHSESATFCIYTNFSLVKILLEINDVFPQINRIERHRFRWKSLLCSCCLTDA